MEAGPGAGHLLAGNLAWRWWHRAPPSHHPGLHLPCAFQAFPHPRGQGDFQDLVSPSLVSSVFASSFPGT